MADRFNRIDGTAPLINAAEQKNVNVPKSGFEFSRSVAGPVTIGAIYPIDCFDTLPGERIDISFNGLVEALQPTITKMLNGFDVYIHCYFNRESDLWEGSKNFTTKGRSGQITGSIPRIDPQIAFVNKLSNTDYYNLDTVGSLFDWLGVQPDLGTSNTPYYDSVTPRKSYLPWSSSDGSKTGIHSTFINAIPFFMYQRLWRDKYAPKNLLQDNKTLFPDNEDHFIIPYSSVRYNEVSYTPDTGSGDFVFTPTNISHSPSSDYYNTLINLGTSQTANYHIYCDRLRFRQFKGDDFTTASPFPDLVRGLIPDLSDFLDPSYSEVVGVYNYSSPIDPSNTSDLKAGGSSPVTFLSSRGIGSGTSIYAANNFSSVTVKSLVALNAYTVFAQRMGRTNGDYDSMIKAQFGFDPQNQSREARYLGGLHFSLGNEVIRQTSESSQSSALGEAVVSSNGSGSGRLASFTSPDYGYVMTVLSIVPNSWYADGQDAYLSAQYQTDRYFPIFEQLGPEAIKNRELFVSGNAAVDDTPFGYAERGYRYKSRRNVVRGLFRAKANQVLDYSSRVTARRFDQTPQLQNGFTTICDDNFDYNIFAYPSEYPFSLACNVEVRRIAPMSEYTAPAGFSPATM